VTTAGMFLGAFSSLRLVLLTLAKGLGAYLRVGYLTLGCS